jgi:hypothetical protein
MSSYPQPGLYGSENLFGDPNLYSYYGYLAQSQMGAVLIDALQPWMTLPLAWYIDAIGSMFDQVYTLTSDVGFDGDVGYVPGYGTIFNPLTCPADDLPYLGQFVGVSVPTGADPVTALSLVTAEAGQARGTLASLQAAIQRNISAPWQANTSYAVGTMLTYGTVPTYYLVPSTFTTGIAFQQYAQENFVGNPSYEYDTLGAAPAWWLVPSHTAPFGSGSNIGPSLGTGITLTTFQVENGWAESGTQSLRITGTNAGGGGNEIETWGTPIPMVYGQSMSMLAGANVLAGAGAYIHPFFVDANYNLISGPQSSVVTSGTGSVSVSATAPLGTSYVIPHLVNYGNTSIDGYWDAICLVWGSTVPSYFDGDTSGSYSWLGTPGNSYSAQSLPVVDPTTQYSIVERQDSTGAANAYWISVFVKPEQLTPASNTTAILAAIDSVKPGGVLINLVASDSPTWGAATKTWGGVTTGTTWGGVISGDV